MKYGTSPRCGVNVISYFDTAYDGELALHAIEYALRMVSPQSEVVEAEVERMPLTNTFERELYQIRFDISKGDGGHLGQGSRAQRVIGKLMAEALAKAQDDPTKHL